MPSSHSTMYYYFIMFISLYLIQSKQSYLFSNLLLPLSTNDISLLSLYISALHSLALYLSYKRLYIEHTLLQLLVGAGLGSLLGIIFYFYPFISNPIYINYHYQISIILLGLSLLYYGQDIKENKKMISNTYLTNVLSIYYLIYLPIFFYINLSPYHFQMNINIISIYLMIIFFI